MLREQAHVEALRLLMVLAHFPGFRRCDLLCSAAARLGAVRARGALDRLPARGAGQATAVRRPDGARHYHRAVQLFRIPLQVDAQSVLHRYLWRYDVPVLDNCDSSRWVSYVSGE